MEGMVSIEIRKVTELEGNNGREKSDESSNDVLETSLTRAGAIGKTSWV